MPSRFSRFFASRRSMATAWFVTTLLSGAPAEKPVFIYADTHGKSTSLDIAERWVAIPEPVRPFAWLDLAIPREFDYERILEGDKRETLPAPVRRPAFEEEWRAFMEALKAAQEGGVPLLLQLNTGRFLERYGLNTGTGEEIAFYDDLLAKHPCIAGLHSAETASFLAMTPGVESHVRAFTALAKKHKRKFVWSAFLGRRVFLWNQLMTDPAWADYLTENADTFVPQWKTVEPADNMLNWADCAGLWLSGKADRWGFKFDSWYFANALALRSGTDRYRYYPGLGRNVMNATLYACPPWLLKDSVILAALTGCSVYSTEAMGAFDYATRGPLRPVLDKTYAFLVSNRLWRDREEVVARAKVVVESPRSPSEAIDRGFTHSDPKRPNRIWDSVFGVERGGVDLIPNEGKNFLVPVVPPGFVGIAGKSVLLRPDEISSGNRLPAALEESHPRRFKASHDKVLLFDAGRFLYVTDSREEDRTTLSFTLDVPAGKSYRCLFLGPDATFLDNVEPAREPKEAGARMKILLPAGCSILFVER